MIPNVVVQLAIALIAAIREKINYSDVPKGLKGMGITFIITGLMSMAFMGLAGISLNKPTGGESDVPGVATYSNEADAMIYDYNRNTLGY